MNVIKIFLFILLTCGTANAACQDSSPDLYPDSGESDLANITVAEVDECVAIASDGDTIHLPSGSVTWASGVIWTNKNISVIGAGIGNTEITASTNYIFSVTDNTDPASFRISGMTLTGVPSASWGYIWISSVAQDPVEAITGWRIDHVRMEIGNHPNPSINIQGLNYGLVDNCEFERAYDGAGDSWHIINYASLTNDPGTYGGSYSMAQSLDLGGSSALHIEDCTFTNTGSGEGGSGNVIDFGAGARIVFRYNTVNDGGLLAHPTKSSSIGPVKYEVYGNIFNSSTGVWEWYIFNTQGGGTGVFFNNRITGTWTYDPAVIFLGDVRAGCVDEVVQCPTVLLSCDGDQAWDGNIESGWPCFMQAGRTGTDGLDSEPVYAWKNGPEATCTSGGACTDSFTITHWGSVSDYIKATAHTNDEVDYVNNGSTPKPSYTPYTYPHPLRGGNKRISIGSILDLVGGILVIE